MNLILSLAIEKKLGFTKVVTKLNMSKKQNEPIIPLFTYHSGKFLLSKKNSDTKKCQRAVMLNWSQFHKFYCDWGKECLFMYCDCVNVFFEKTRHCFYLRLDWSYSGCFWSSWKWYVSYLLVNSCQDWGRYYLEHTSTQTTLSFYNYYLWSKQQSGLGVVRRFLTLLGWFSNRTVTSVDDGKACRKN